MKDSTSFAPKMLHSENIFQESEPKQDEKPWLRQKNEPANWYMRFQIYLKLGSKRSLQAALASEPSADKAPKGTKRHQETKNLTDVSLSVPGSWKRTSKLWNWVERASAYDQHVRWQQTQVMRTAAAHMEYSSRAWRVMELNFLIKSLKSAIQPETPIKDTLAIVARIQSLFRDIDAEMAKLGMEDEADAEVLITFFKQRKAEGIRDFPSV